MFILLLILVAIGIIVYKVGKWSVQFGQFDEKVKEVGNNKDRLIRLETKVDLIYQNTLRDPLVMAHSPISLTKTGKDVASKIEAQKIFDKYYSDLKNKIEEEKPKNAYDIQEASMKVARESMENLLNEEELTAVKAFARGLLVEDIMSIFGILLRDKVLEEKKIPIAEVDKTKK